MICTVHLYAFLCLVKFHKLTLITTMKAHLISLSYRMMTSSNHFPRYRPFVWGSHQFPVTFPHKGLLRRALMFSLFYAWTNGWVNNRDARDLRRHQANYGVTVMERVIYASKILYMTRPLSVFFGSCDVTVMNIVYVVLVSRTPDPCWSTDPGQHLMKVCGVNK